MKVRARWVAFWVMLFLLWYTWPTECFAQDDFDTRLIIKLSEMMKVEPPKTILIERLSQKEMLSQFRDYVMTECLRVAGMERFQYCNDLSRQATSNAFVHGHWVEKKDPSKD